MLFFYVYLYNFKVLWRPLATSERSRLPGVDRLSKDAGGDSRPLGLLLLPKRLGGGKEGLPADLWPPEAAAAAAANIEERFCKQKENF